MGDHPSGATRSRGAKGGKNKEPLVLPSTALSCMDRVRSALGPTHVTISEPATAGSTPWALRPQPATKNMGKKPAAVPGPRCFGTHRR